MPDREKVVTDLEALNSAIKRRVDDADDAYGLVAINLKYWQTVKDAIALLKAPEPADYIPIDWLMNYAQLPTEFAISAWRKPKKEAEIKQAKSLDKPMSLDDALELLKAQEPIEPEFVKHIEPDLSYWMCGACGAFLWGDVMGTNATGIRPNYCQHCGREIDWNDRA